MLIRHFCYSTFFPVTYGEIILYVSCWKFNTMLYISYNKTSASNYTVNVQNTNTCLAAVCKMRRKGKQRCCARQWWGYSPGDAETLCSGQQNASHSLVLSGSTGLKTWNMIEFFVNIYILSTEVESRVDSWRQMVFAFWVLVFSFYQEETSLFASFAFSLYVVSWRRSRRRRNSLASCDVSKG